MYKSSGCQKDTLGFEWKFFCHLISKHSQLRWVMLPPTRNFERIVQAIHSFLQNWKQMPQPCCRALKSNSPQLFLNFCGGNKALSCVCHFSLHGQTSFLLAPHLLRHHEQIVIVHSRRPHHRLVACVNYILYAAIRSCNCKQSLLIKARILEKQQGSFRLHWSHPCFFFRGRKPTWIRYMSKGSSHTHGMRYKQETSCSLQYWGKK